MFVVCGLQAGCHCPMAVSFSYFSPSIATATCSLYLSLLPFVSLVIRGSATSNNNNDERTSIQPSLLPLFLHTRHAPIHDSAHTYTHNSYLSFSPFLLGLPCSPLSPFVALVYLYSVVWLWYRKTFVYKLLLAVHALPLTPSTSSSPSPFVFRLSLFPSLLLFSLHFSHHHSPSLPHLPPLS
ncbi:hypothetical protein K457DRAFT_603242 [Linnemannia elongata AG-77]|uniref:Uncharacterized protein n=1 Tax=Linnemannia elongata AG-77 TaxID=1314771 RepID=A0A197JS39_9FUNG|nr:hypothetical protein K457DRAFT_603242 [Linnemannia elongata AG-77]